MSNATDVLCVGGAANGRMICVNRPAPVTVDAFTDYESFVNYTLRKWWHPEHLRWYWIATTAEDPVADVTIIAELVAAQMQPAWDLKDLPAPSDNTNEES